MLLIGCQHYTCKEMWQNCGLNQEAGGGIGGRAHLSIYLFIYLSIYTNIYLYTHTNSDLPIDMFAESLSDCLSDIKLTD